MNWIRHYQLFLFDFDGLLVDTERLHFLAYQELCRRYGCELKWSFERFCEEAHRKAMSVWEGLAKEFPSVWAQLPSKEVLYEEKKQIYVELLQHSALELMPGAEVLLKVLEEAKIKRAVVTNSPKAHIELIVKTLPPLQTIPVWITREDYLRPKPFPDGYHKAIEILAKPQDRIIGFEDSLKGLEALLAAGVESVLVCPAHHVSVATGVSLGARHVATLSDVCEE